MVDVCRVRLWFFSFASAVNCHAAAARSFLVAVNMSVCLFVS